MINASKAGSDTANADCAVCKLFRLRQRWFGVAVLCDGVGKNSIAPILSGRLGVAALDLSVAFARERCEGGISISDVEELRKRLESGFNFQLPAHGASTLLIAIIDIGPRNSSLLCAYAGDSRLYLISKEQSCCLITTDCYDEHGRLTSFVTGDGRIIGTLGVTFVDISDSSCFALTSDGVHGACDQDELRDFLIYLLQRNVNSSERLVCELKSFLGSNAQDDFSIILGYFPMNTQQHERRAIDGE